MPRGRLADISRTPKTGFHTPLHLWCIGTRPEPIAPPKVPWSVGPPTAFLVRPPSWSSWQHGEQSRSRVASVSMLVPVLFMVQDWHVMHAIIAPSPAPTEPLEGLPVGTLLRRALESARSIYIRKGTLEGAGTPAVRVGGAGSGRDGASVGARRTTCTSIIPSLRRSLRRRFRLGEHF